MNYDWLAAVLRTCSVAPVCRASAAFSPGSYPSFRLSSETRRYRRHTTRREGVVRASSPPPPAHGGPGGGGRSADDSVSFSLPSLVRFPLAHLSREDFLEGSGGESAPLQRALGQEETAY